MRNLFLLFLLFFAFSSFKSNALYIQYADVDTGICNLSSPAMFRIKPNWVNGFYHSSFSFTINFGDGNSYSQTDTADNYYNIFSHVYYVNHQYTAPGPVDVKMYLYDSSNVLVDSFIQTYNVGACTGKYTGTVYFDNNNNCQHNIYEAPLFNRMFTFKRNNAQISYLLDTLGQFNLPIYSGDTITIQTGSYDWPNAFVGTCSYPVITSDSFNNFIPVELMNYGGAVNFSVNPYICLSPPISMTYLSFNIPNSYGNVYKYSNLDAWNQYVSASNNPVDFNDYFFNGAGTYTYHYGVFNPNYYGPLLIIPITFYIDTCQTVTVKTYYDANMDCIKNIGEQGIDTASIYMHSNYYGNLSFQTDANGEVNYSVFPGDTIRIDSTMYNIQTVFGSYTYVNMNNACGMNYFTDSSAIVEVPFKPQIYIQSVIQNNSPACISDTALLTITAQNMGLGSGTNYLLIINYDDGNIDTLSLTTSASDTILLNVSHMYAAAGTYYPGFKFVFPNGVEGTINGQVVVYNCKKIFVKTFYDENNNCVKDVNEPFIKDFKAYTAIYGNTYYSDTNSRSAICTMMNTDYIGAIHEMGDYGYGLFSKTYNDMICHWQDTFTAYHTYILPLNENINIIGSNADNVPPSCFIPYTCSNVSVLISLSGNHRAFPFMTYLYHGDGKVEKYMTPYIEGGPTYFAFYYNHTYTSYGKFKRPLVLKDTIHFLDVAYSNFSSAVNVSDQCGPLHAMYFTDSNSNCLPDTGDIKLPYQLLKSTYLSGDSLWKFSKYNGSVSFDSLSPVMNLYSPGRTFQGDLLHCNFSYVTITNYNVPQLFPYKYFAQNEWAVEATHHKFESGQVDTFYIFLQHNKSVNPTGTLTMNLDNQLTYIGASTTPGVIAGQQLSWQFSSSDPVPSMIKVFATVNSTPGSILTNDLTVSNLPGEGDLTNNHFALIDSVRNYPTVYYKTSSCYDALANGDIDGTQPIIYKVEYQNTSGKSMTQLRIIDSLSSYLDISTLQILYASRQSNLFMNNNHVFSVEVNDLFSDSSTNFANSTYCIIFSIQPIHNLPGGTEIYNDALMIASDSISTVALSNQTKNTIKAPNQLTEQSSLNPFSVYPNPANDVIFITRNDDAPATFELYTLEGRKLRSELLTTKETALDIRTFSAGIYLIKITQDGTVFTQKFIKQK